MAKKVVDETSLTSIANAIREKTGASDALVFPTGMVEAIAGISAGGEALKITSGVFTLTEPTGGYVINHGLGVIPKYFHIFAVTHSFDASLIRVIASAHSGEFPAIMSTKTSTYKNSSASVYHVAQANYLTEDGTNFNSDAKVIYGATEENVIVGRKDIYMLQNNTPYAWIAIG